MNDDQSLRTVRQRSRRILADKSGSFDWAAMFLPADRRDDAAVVYAFCRLVDDIADETDSPEVAADKLDKIRDELQGNRPSRPLVSGFRQVCNAYDISLEYPLELIRGVESDLDAVCIETDRDLLRYCYRVAGTVGLMMTPLLGVDDPRARHHAVDLGVGMQITNICRDVLEDAQNGRIYIPTSRLTDAGIAPDALLAGRADREALSSVVADLLNLADRYYESGRDGMHYIPLRSRVAIRVASRVYRAIGVTLRRDQQCDPMQGRATVGTFGKLRWIGSALADTLNPFTGSTSLEHEAELHGAFGELPGTNPAPKRLDARS